jgi:hypothetical protein
MRASRWLAIASTLIAFCATDATRAMAQQPQPERLGFSRAKLDVMSDFFKAEVAAAGCLA